jgi:pyroglutamyl-peptidase
MRVLLTCFEPFGGSVENASGEVAALVAAKWSDADVELVVRTMSVAFDVGLLQLRRSVEELRPQAILSLGEDDMLDGCTVELVGRNAADPSFAGVDSSEIVPIDDGPDHRACTFEAADVRDRMRAVGVSTELSEDAGLHMCNAFAYLLPTFGVPAGFVHVPAVRSTASDVLDSLARGVAAAVRSLQQQFALAAAVTSSSPVSAAPQP